MRQRQTGSLAQAAAHEVTDTNGDVERRRNTRAEMQDRRSRRPSAVNREAVEEARLSSQSVNNSEPRCLITASSSPLPLKALRNRDISVQCVLLLRL